MLQYGEPNLSYDSVLFELNLEVTPMMLWRKMRHLEEIALNLWWKKVPLPREEKIQNMSLRNQLNMMLRDQIGMLRNQTQNQKARDEQVHNPPASQMHWLLCEYMTHRCQTMKKNGDRLNRKWYERSLLRLLQVTLALDLFNLKLCDAETQRRQYQNFHLR